MDGGLGACFGEVAALELGVHQIGSSPVGLQGGSTIEFSRIARCHRLQAITAASRGRKAGTAEGCVTGPSRAPQSHPALAKADTSKNAFSRLQPFMLALASVTPSRLELARLHCSRFAPERSQLHTHGAVRIAQCITNTGGQASGLLAMGPLGGPRAHPVSTESRRSIPAQATAPRRAPFSHPLVHAGWMSNLASLRTRAWSDLAHSQHAQGGLCVQISRGHASQFPSFDDLNMLRGSTLTAGRAPHVSTLHIGTLQVDTPEVGVLQCTIVQVEPSQRGPPQALVCPPSQKHTL